MLFMPVRAASSGRSLSEKNEKTREGMEEDGLLDLPASVSGTVMGRLQTPQTPILDFFGMERSTPER